MAAARPLSRVRILKAAFAIADKRGLEAVTMRSVAARLDVEAMSLYHHVPSKKAMLNGLVDLLVQVAAMPSGDVTAEEWIRGTAAGLRALAQRHPRLVPLLSAGPVPLDDPASALPFEAGLAAFARAGYGLPDGFAALQAVAVALLAMTQLEATATLQQGSEEESALAALPIEDFPLLHQVLEAPTGLDDFWRTLVDGLVRGLTP
ncbi:MAG: transcriptional regulator, TetR family [Frankiales bacterium]|nr:transcriptional regulator, TetR family [Frankiales bacterium]